MRGKADWELCQLFEAVHRFSANSKRIRLFGRVCGILREKDDPSPYNAKADSVLFAVIKRWVSMLKSKLSVAEFFDLDEKDGKAWMVSKKLEKGCDELFSTCPAWTFDHLLSSLKEYKVKRPWMKRREELRLKLEGLRRSTKTMGFLSGELRGASRITNVDSALYEIMRIWFEEAKDLFLSLNVAQKLKVDAEQREFDRKYAILEDARTRPWSPTETKNIRKGITLYGDIQSGKQDPKIWEAIIRNKSFGFLHRRPRDMERHWLWILAEDQRKEKRKWNWRRWPWDPAWDWGALLVISDGAPRDLQQRVDTLKGNMYDVDEEDDPEWREGDSSDDSAEFSSSDEDQDIESDASFNSGFESDVGDSDDQAWLTAVAAKANEDSEEKRSVRGEESDHVEQVSEGFADMIECSSPRLEDSAIRIQKHFRGKRGRLYGRFGIIPSEFSAQARASLNLSSQQSEKRMAERSPSKLSLTLNMSRNTSATNLYRNTSEGTLILNHWSVNKQELKEIADSASHYSNREAHRVAKTKRAYAKHVIREDARGSMQELKSIITVIELRDNNIDQRNAKDLTLLLEAHKETTSLDLAQNKIGAEGCKALATWFRHPLCKIQELNISANALTDRAIKSLYTGLQKAFVLREINLSNNLIADKGAMLLGKHLTSASCLISTLLLPWNKIGPQGGIALAEALAVNKSVKVCSLQFNNMGKSYMSFFQALRENRSIQYMDLSFNGAAGIDDCAMLGDGLCLNNAIQTFEFNGNEVSTLSARRLLNAIISPCPVFSTPRPPKGGKKGAKKGLKKGGKKGGGKSAVQTQVKTTVKAAVDVPEFLIQFLDDRIPEGKRIPPHAAHLARYHGANQREGVEQIQKIFKELDLDGDGAITLADLRKNNKNCKEERTTDDLIKWLGARVGKAAIPRRNGDAGVSFPDFLCHAWEEAENYLLSVAMTAQRYFEEAERIAQVKRDAKKREVIMYMSGDKSPGEYKLSPSGLANANRALRPGLTRAASVLVDQHRTIDGDAGEGQERCTDTIAHPLRISLRSCHVTSTPRVFLSGKKEGTERE